MWFEMIFLITGAASGFGLLTARSAAKRGHTVYAGCRDLASFKTDGDSSPAIVPLQLDVTKPAEREAAMREILSKHGQLDVLVNNAGVTLGGFLETVEEDELARLFAINVFAAFALTKLALPSMRKRRNGSIINVSSMSERMAVPGLGAYAASKFALEGLSEAWRHELAPFGIRVSVVEPGPYKTDIVTRNRTMARGANDPVYQELSKRVSVLADSAIERSSPPEEVAELIVTIAESPAPKFRHPIGAGAGARTFLLRFAPTFFERYFRKLFARV